MQLRAPGAVRHAPRLAKYSYVCFFCAVLVSVSTQAFPNALNVYMLAWPVCLQESRLVTIPQLLEMDKTKLLAPTLCQAVNTLQQHVQVAASSVSLRGASVCCSGQRPWRADSSLAQYELLRERWRSIAVQSLPFTNHFEHGNYTANKQLIIHYKQAIAVNSDTSSYLKLVV